MLGAGGSCYAQFRLFCCQDKMTTAFPHQSRFSAHATLFGILLICFTALNLVAASVLLIVGIPSIEFSPFIAGALTAFVGWVGVTRWFQSHHLRIWLRHLALALVVIAGWTPVEAGWLDTSIDGQTYQAEGVWALAEGWNPYRTNAPENADYPLYLGFFSKGPWVNAASLYRLTSNIEAGKSFQGILLVATLAVSLGTLSAQLRLPLRHAMVLSLLLALNPVSVVQLFTYYVDGQVASCLTILVCLFWLLESRFDPLVLLAVGLVSLLIISLKLNGAIYLAVLAGGFLVWLWMRRHPYRRRITLWLLASILLAVLLVGYNPFITQYAAKFLSNGDPFYPTQWTTLIRIEPNTPVDLLQRDRFSRLAFSLFAQAQADVKPGSLKLPFMVYPQELLNFRYPDTRLAGFGPLFSGALVLAAGLAAAALWRARKRLGSLPFPAFLLVLIALSVLISDQGWWARYAPQLWLLPVLTAALALSSSWRWLRRGALLLALALFINVTMITVTVVALGMFDQRVARADLAALREQSARAPIEVNFNQTPLTRWRFDRMGIAYHVTEDMPACAPGQTLRNVLHSLSIVCAD
jgi:hypothetical protein